MMKRRTQKICFAVLSIISVFVMLFFADSVLPERWLVVESSDDISYPEAEAVFFDDGKPPAKEETPLEPETDVLEIPGEFPDDEEIMLAREPELELNDLTLPSPDVPEVQSPVYLQFQYLPFVDYYVFSKDEKVNGLAFGYHLPQKEINGISVGLVQVFNSKKSGFCLSLVDLSGNLHGMSMFLAGGAVNNNGCLIGLWNMTENNRGIQIGLFNHAADKAMENCSPVTEKDEKGFGVQAGVINYSDSPGIQFGLWNTNPNSWIKHFPLFNICL